MTNENQAASLTPPPSSSESKSSPSQSTGLKEAEAEAPASDESNNENRVSATSKREDREVERQALLTFAGNQSDESSNCSAGKELFQSFESTPNVPLTPAQSKEKLTDDQQLPLLQLAENCEDNQQLKQQHPLEKDETAKSSSQQRENDIEIVQHHQQDDAMSIDALVPIISVNENEIHEIVSTTTTSRRPAQVRLSDAAVSLVSLDSAIHTDTSVGSLNINIIQKEPIVVRGNGNITIFGVSNRFDDQFPSQLMAKLAPEEYGDTMKQVNNILAKELSNSFKWLLIGSLCCCCTLGCSLIPVIFMNKKAKLSLNKYLALENQRLYRKLGLKWRLAKIKCNSSALFEYVILIEFAPTKLLYQPE